VRLYVFHQLPWYTGLVLSSKFKFQICYMNLAPDVRSTELKTGRRIQAQKTCTDSAVDSHAARPCVLGGSIIRQYTTVEAEYLPAASRLGSLVAYN
jgi:hypothetical protein